MVFLIKGYDIRYSSKAKAEVFASFRGRAECYRYLNMLKTGCLSDTHKFFVEEVHSYEPNSNTLH